MFQQLFELTKVTSLIMKISADAESGKLTLIVIPTPATNGEKGGDIEPALTQKLSLTATPDEFEQSFPQCLSGYTDKYKSLQEQVETTNAVLDAAKNAQVQKGTKAVAKTTNKITPTQVAVSSEHGKSSHPDGDEDGDGGETDKATVDAGEPGLFD